jgi:mycothione reductase
MKTYDIIIIGAGSGLNISSAAASMGMKVAVIEKGPMGGTCLNRGCIPSKIIIHSADVANAVRNSKDFGISSKLSSVDFRKITSRASNIVDVDARQIEQGINYNKNTALYKGTAKFVGVRTLKIGNTLIKGKKIVIAAGTRPFIPPIEGLNKINYLTSTEALRLKKQPKALTILGGGYIAAELAHFYGSLGTKINIIQRNKFMIPNEDEEIAEKFTKIFRKKYNVLTNYYAQKVMKNGNKITTIAKGKNDKKKLVSDQVLVATGRVSNGDTLDLEKGGIKLNKRNFVIVNNYLETSSKNVWALGDIAGKYFFKHSANLEAQYVFYNAIMNKKLKVNYTAMPHAVFSSPQIAGVGLREQDLKNSHIDYSIGKCNYANTGMGIAIQEKNGFVKIFASRKTKKILGCHIMGANASVLIQEVILAMRFGLKADSISNSIHIHPSLSEVVQRAASNIEW